MNDYAHARHAGNAADVFKHIALVTLLDVLRGDPSPIRYVESHAGDGLYTLASNGEWSAGLQRLWAATPTGESSDPLDTYLATVARWSPLRAERPHSYPGSPLIAGALLRPQDSLSLFDIDATSSSILRGALENDARAQIHTGDGLQALPEALAAQPGRAAALVDPSYGNKDEWPATAAAVCEAHRAAPNAPILLWYPIKALTRPRGLIAHLLEGGAHGTAVELITTPLRLKRDRLAGSGVIFIATPARVVSRLCAALVRVGPALMTHGEWSGQQIGF